jgi:hypothetical protein
MDAPLDSSNDMALFYGVTRTLLVTGWSGNDPRPALQPPRRAERSSFFFGIQVRFSTPARIRVRRGKTRGGSGLRRNLHLFPDPLKEPSRPTLLAPEYDHISVLRAGF